MSGIDWSPVTDLIVTCGFDRNAYVWRYDTTSQTWKPTLVILRINRAATQVKWYDHTHTHKQHTSPHQPYSPLTAAAMCVCRSPDGQKFAVSSGAKSVPVCHFEQSNDWWISKMIKKHKSTILSIAWSPNGRFLLTGCADMKARVFSAHLTGLDKEDDSAGYGSVWADQYEFGELLAEFDQGKAWVHAVSWSPTGRELAFAAHSSILTFIDVFNIAKGGQTVYVRDLPYLDMSFVNDTTLVAAGFDSNIDVYNKAADSWSFKDKLDKKGSAKPAAAAGGVAGAAAAFGGARRMFTEAADKGGSFGVTLGGTDIVTRHKNVITNLCVLEGGKKISTSGLDGRVILWTV